MDLNCKLLEIMRFPLCPRVPSLTVEPRYSEKPGRTPMQRGAGALLLKELK